MFFLLYRHNDDGVFDGFPKVSDQLPKVSEDSPKHIITSSEYLNRSVSRCLERQPQANFDFALNSCRYANIGAGLFESWFTLTHDFPCIKIILVAYVMCNSKLSKFKRTNTMKRKPHLTVTKLKSKFLLILGQLNWALNNPAQIDSDQRSPLLIGTNVYRERLYPGAF